VLTIDTLESARPVGTGFETRLVHEGISLRRSTLDALQINVGRLCNQACQHCHVDAGPTRTEVMSRETMDRVLDFLAASEIPTVDITGGAPEANPSFRHLVRKGRGMGRHVMVRCNLTIVLEPDQEDLPRFYRDQGAELVCSLPCYLEENVDGQRGRGVFARSIQALRILNRIGYGQDDTGLLLNLVYNPVGASLPPPQAELEADYREALSAQYGIHFNRLFTITRSGEYGSYMHDLQQSFNVGTLEHLMCRSLVSVDWEGNIYDCDFNQMLGMHLGDRPLKIWEVTPDDLIGRRIRVADHCFGCTAGAGSSCGGELV
jgi:radical SAM/Cys-rich protein